MPNRLSASKSLYLRQHADNPVDWYPWGPEALERARLEDKPILVSIGYSACHWCHVMAHESFEDPYIARLMNTHFVCIKVDREERPDLDAIYMDAVQMLQGHGGWPLNVFCLPDGRPFAGGTYFPPDDRRGYGRVSWPQLLMRVADFYQRQRADLEENAFAVIGNLQKTNLPQGAADQPIGREVVLRAAERLIEAHDPEFGGFGGAPKFPPCSTLDFLLALRNTDAVDQQRPQLAASLDAVINRTLTGMAHGGLFDQIGGGFARYSVDAHWLIPHFEKMLYDNAQLIDIYSKAFQRYPKPLYAAVVEETIGWLVREMLLPCGAFAAAQDADTEGEEGRTYLWTPQEVASILGEAAAARFCEVYGITQAGNFENSGRSHPALLDGDPRVRAEMAPARARLLQARLQRPQPACDNKCLTAWNALLMRGLTQAAFTFGRPDWLQLAVGIGDWIWESMRCNGDRLWSVAYDGQPGLNGHLDDYAYAVDALLYLAGTIDWLHPGHSKGWLDRALLFTQTIRHHFRDPASPGYFFTSDDHEALVHRRKDWYDNAAPAANSSLLHSFALLELLTGSPEFAQEYECLDRVYPAFAELAPAAVPCALSAFVQRASGICVLKLGPAADRQALRTALAARPWRRVFWQSEPQLTAAYQLCIGTQCLAPTNDLHSCVDAIGGA